MSWKALLLLLVLLLLLKTTLGLLYLTILAVIVADVYEPLFLIPTVAITTFPW